MSDNEFLEQQNFDERYSVVMTAAAERGPVPRPIPREEAYEFHVRIQPPISADADSVRRRLAGFHACFGTDVVYDKNESFVGAYLYPLHEGAGTEEDFTRFERLVRQVAQDFSTEADGKNEVSVESVGWKKPGEKY